MAAPAARFAINVIEDGHKRLLFLKRGTDRELGPGQWGFCAGHIEDGETPQACSRRELAEELGAAVEVEPVRQFGPVRDTAYGGRYEIWLFHYRWLGGDVRLDEEHTEYRWVGKDEYPALDIMHGIDEDLVYLDIWSR